MLFHASLMREVAFVPFKHIIGFDHIGLPFFGSSLDGHLFNNKDRNIETTLPFR